MYTGLLLALPWFFEIICPGSWLLKLPINQIKKQSDFLVV